MPKSKLKTETEKFLEEFPSGVPFGALESLLLFAENASVTATANTKDRETSTVTRHLDQLDEYFACTLRSKIGKTSIISAQGQELVTLLRRQLQEIKDFREKNTQNLNFVSLAAGDSLLHVLVLPHLHKIQMNFDRTVISVSAARTFQIVEGLQDMALDLGLLRENSIPRKRRPKPGEALTYEPIGNYRYAIFVPSELWKGIGKDPSRVFNLPFAVIKHHWDTNFLQLAKRDGITFSNLRVLCENFIQVFHLVRVGQYAGILPLFCAPLLRGAERVDTPFLEEPTHKIVLAWNPALLKIRNNLEPVAQCPF